MEKGVAIKVESVSKIFKIPHEKISSVRGAFVNALKSKSYEEFKALENVSFEIKKGEFFGIIGRNGSGKSTLLKILAGIYQADKGKIDIDGMISPFLELGIGFNPELSGRDNIYLNATVLGMTKRQIDKKFDDIVSFSELERFIDQKLKNYSSGMQVRLAFSVAIHANRDILLMDEVLAVGDTNFQSKCLEEFNRYKRLGKTVIFVTHDISTVQRYCDRAMLLRNGKIMKIGKAATVGDEYIYQNMTDEERRIFNEEDQEKKETEEGLEKIGGNQLEAEKEKIKEEERKQEKKRRRTMPKIAKVELLDKTAKETCSIRTHDAIEVRIFFNNLDKLREQMNVGISIESGDGHYLLGYSTEMDGYIPDNEKEYLSLSFSDMRLLSGSYAVNVTVIKKNSGALIDYKPRVKTFNVFSSGSEATYKGFLSIDHKWTQR